MRSAFFPGLLLSLISISGCTNKVHVFVKHTDVEEAALKGRVNLATTYICSLDSTGAEHCSTWVRKFNAQGFKIEVLDTSGNDFFITKYSYNSDGLLAKLTFSANSPFSSPSESSYLYSFSERKKTVVTRTFGSSPTSIDSSVSLYDKNGNEIEHKSSDTKWTYKYDEHGFLVWDKFTIGRETIESNYINNKQGRVLKKTRSDGLTITYVYNKDGNTVQERWIDAKGEVKDHFIGYCEVDKNGNYLKLISVCPQTKSMGINRQLIEYY